MMILDIYTVAWSLENGENGGGMAAVVAANHHEAGRLVIDYLTCGDLKRYNISITSNTLLISNVDGYDNQSIVAMGGYRV